MRKKFVPFLMILLCFSLLMTFPCKAGTVWSDNFNDGNYEGWTVSGALNPFSVAEILENGSFSAASKVLQAGGSPTVDPSLWSWASHPSTVATGTWSFDLYMTSAITSMDVGVILILDKPTYTVPLDWHGYTLELAHTGVLYLWRWNGGSSTNFSEIGSGTFPYKEGSWIHIDVTRNADGRFCVYTNGTLRIDAVDKRYFTSSYFLFESRPGPAIDNIVVSNTVDIQPPPTVPFYMQTWFLASVGVVAVVAVVLIVLLRHKK
jgi:hypothetical protein